jgi:putative PIN family toxin of toxin-antitoxin system
VKVFLDTNVLVASLASRGLCSELLEHIIHEHELLTCQPVLSELERVLADKLRLPGPVVAGFLGLLTAEGAIVEPGERPAVTIRDADDLPILACAIAGKADAFVTGDGELLELGRVGNLPIVSPRQLWLRLMGIEEPEKPRK